MNKNPQITDSGKILCRHCNAGELRAKLAYPGRLECLNCGETDSHQSLTSAVAPWGARLPQGGTLEQIR